MEKNSPPTSSEAPVLNIVGERVALGPLRKDLLPLYGNPDEAQALDDERARLGRAPTERERVAFLGGFRAARLEHANGR